MTGAALEAMPAPATCAGTAIGETRKARATRLRLLDAAMHIVAFEGHHAAQNARIAEAAGVARGVINYHYPDRRAFVEALVAHVEWRKRERFARLTEALRRGPRVHAEAAIDGYWGLLQETPFVAFAELEAAGRTDPMLADVLAAPRRRFDHAAPASGALEPLDALGASSRQTLCDLCRFLLEGLARGVMTYDREVRTARLLTVLKQIVATTDHRIGPPPILGG